MNTKILVVDDSNSMRAMIAGVINSIGYQAVEASSGEQACEIFAVEPIDIAVLDVNMDGIDGFETCRRLRKLAKNSWFPVIYLSATDSVDNIVEGLDAGGDAYVTKPVNPRVLEAILKAMGRIADMKQALNQANEKLERLAAYDGLTQIPNRRSFDESLVRFTLQAKREKSTLALILLDIDHFKAYNDHYGHQQGDSSLIQFASALDTCLMRPVDMAYRYGGEEFAVLLPNTDQAGAEQIAKRIQQALKDIALEHAASPSDKVLTVSMGVAFSPDGATEPVELIDRADDALYKAKEQGRNRYVFSP